VFDHVKIGVSDFAASKKFFIKALEPLGVAVAAEGAPSYGIGHNSAIRGKLFYVCFAKHFCHHGS